MPSPSTSASQAEHMLVMAFIQAERIKAEAFSQATHRPFAVADIPIMDIAEPADAGHIDLAGHSEDDRHRVTVSPRRTFFYFFNYIFNKLFMLL